MANDIYAPQNGETSLGDEYVSAMGQGAQRDVTAAIFDSFKRMFGRNPTSSEVAQAYPQFYDPQGQGLSRGNAYVANLKQQIDNTPQNVYAKQQSQYLSQAPGHYDSVNQAFQSLLGRDATDAEKQHFGAAMAAGADQYQLEDTLKQTTEYANAQDQKFRNQLQSQLQQTNSDYFNQYIMPSLQSQFAAQGRTVDSSGFQNAMAQAAKQQNYNLSDYLAQLSASQYGGNVANARNNYANYINQQYNLQNAGVSNALQNMQSNYARSNELNDYYTQQNAYNEYLKNYGKRGGWVNDLSTGLNIANNFLNLGRGWYPGSNPAPVNQQQLGGNRADLGGAYV